MEAGGGLSDADRALLAELGTSRADRAGWRAGEGVTDDDPGGRGYVGGGTGRPLVLYASSGAPDPWVRPGPRAQERPAMNPTDLVDAASLRDDVPAFCTR